MKDFSCFFVGIAAGCILASCQPDSKDSKGTTAVELNAGAMPVAECAILNDKETFARHGIVLKLTKAASGTQISDGVVGGGLDFGFTNLVTPIIAHSRSIPLRIIGPISVEDAHRARHKLLVRADSGINSIADLRGKTLALNSLQNIDHLMLVRWLESNGVDPGSVKLHTTPFPNMVVTLMNGGVDGVALVEPFITLAMQKEGKFKDLGNYYANAKAEPTAVSGFVVRADWIERNPKTASQLFRALSEAAEKATSDTDAFRKLVVEMTGSDEDVVSQMPLPWYVFDRYDGLVSELARVAKTKNFVDREVEEGALIYKPLP